MSIVQRFATESYVDLKDVATQDFVVEKINEIDVQPNWEEDDENSKAYIQNKPIEETEDDALELLAEMGVLEATVDTDGAILTDENNNILTV